MRRAWYLGVTEADVPERAILVGDRGRVLKAAELLEGSRMLNEDRGLTTAVGAWDGIAVMVSAFGMGAPIAAVVMHELADLGATRFIRAGTMMIRQGSLGTFIVADRALVHEGTSSAYGMTEPAVDLDGDMADRLLAALSGHGVSVGTVASCDGFYTQMTGLLGSRIGDGDLDELWDREGVLGVDMETSALASVARYLDVEFGSICLASVTSEGPEMMGQEERAGAETNLLRAAFRAVTAGP